MPAEELWNRPPIAQVAAVEALQRCVMYALVDVTWSALHKAQRFFLDFVRVTNS